MVKTDEEWTWNAIKDLVKHLDLQVNDVKQMWNEIDADNPTEEVDDDIENCMPEYTREMKFGN